ncbi:ABC transporter ATP-binding protein [Paradevosia shaoguanensis]|uniref:ABC transporter ATP-binding protein n=1 Tax=Paradevosia shaoguanensis TaxID=1335043 RepID=A0AA41QJR1_9HYPH|nr:ABC transporter ATP-binding protein [Paradevosia shaoguanensis]MCF1741401.1 ABC transporter ATP-binding protein [Paradevosia shaoguanensis]MCI0125884.1 ABC transporter ATP-binding protein [Paradevosia shaoguanensis]
MLHPMPDAPMPKPKRAPLVTAQGLTVDMPLGRGAANVRIVDNIDFSIGVGERVALVGESGSGKSLTARALMRLDRLARLSGRIDFDGTDLLKLPEREMTRYRGDSIAMVFQDPMSFLDPLMTIGDQVAETLRIRGVGRTEARKRALAVLDELGVDRAAERLDSYPHEFSGGMRQRVVLAMALVGEPRLLIADEPTTALDVRVQDQVLDLLDDVSTRRGLAVLFITHDLGVVAGFAERVMVMYSGRIVEDGEVETVFARPKHPYTRGLIKAVPRIDQDLHKLYAIPGAPPPPLARPSGCPFHPRCSEAFDRCRSELPVVLDVAGERVACHLHDPLRA